MGATLARPAAKTGVVGGIVAVVPARWRSWDSRRASNDAGNRVRAMKAIEFISDELGVNLFGSGR